MCDHARYGFCHIVKEEVRCGQLLSKKLGGLGIGGAKLAVTSPGIREAPDWEAVTEMSRDGVWNAEMVQDVQQ